MNKFAKNCRLSLNLQLKSDKIQDQSLHKNDAFIKRSRSGKTCFHVDNSETLNFSDEITVEAWVNCKDASPEGLQVILAKWALLNDFKTFSAYDAGNIDNLDTSGYCGSVFDGRYVYFAPQHDRKFRHGKVLRFDTHGDFKSLKSWAGFNGDRIDELKTRGFVSAVFDGRYVHFIPRYNGEDRSSHFLRYDTIKDFHKKSSWDAFDPGLSAAFQGAGFDGKFIYCVPGTQTGGKRSDIVLRYDTKAPYKDKKNWTPYDIGTLTKFKGSGIGFDGAVFDGRYMYFAPLRGTLIRYDTTTVFADDKSWQSWKPSHFKVGACIGAVFDGQYIYFVPYAKNSTIVRYDTTGEFGDAAALTYYNASGTSELKTTGYDGGIFDGRYIYFIPFYDGSHPTPATKAFHGNVLRYDTTKEFENSSSWIAYNAGETSDIATKGFSAGSFDGRFAYFAPWHAGEAGTNKDGKTICGHGRVLRYDTTGDSGGSFMLKYVDYGHNGGLGAALPGTTFLLNTENGALSVSSNTIPQPGRHYVVGVYDGKKIKLFIDGKLVNERTGTGKIVSSKTGLNIGKLHEGKGLFNGKIEQVNILDIAVTEKWIESQYIKKKRKI